MENKFSTIGTDNKHVSLSAGGEHCFSQQSACPLPPAILPAGLSLTGMAVIVTALLANFPETLLENIQNFPGNLFKMVIDEFRHFLHFLNPLSSLIMLPLSIPHGCRLTNKSSPLESSMTPTYSPG